MPREDLCKGPHEDLKVMSGLFGMRLSTGGSCEVFGCDGIVAHDCLY